MKGYIKVPCARGELECHPPCPGYRWVKATRGPPLSTIEEARKRATAGPWTVRAGSAWQAFSKSAQSVVLSGFGRNDEPSANVRLAVHCRNNLPRLLAAIKAREAALREWVDALDAGEPNEDCLALRRKWCGTAIELDAAVKAAWALLTDQCHKFWPARCEGHEIAGMLLEPLLPMEGACGSVYIRCVVTGATAAWNRAAELGWVLDRKGKPFQAYYSPEGLGTISGTPVDEEAVHAPA